MSTALQEAQVQHYKERKEREEAAARALLERKQKEEEEAKKAEESKKAEEEKQLAAAQKAIADANAARQAQLNQLSPEELEHISRYLVYLQEGKAPIPAYRKLYSRHAEAKSG